MPAAQFVTQEDAELDFFEPAQLAPGCVTIWYSPRGLGKTHAAHATLIRQVRLGRRVLLIDRDNSPREVRRRLRGWGVHGTSGLDLLTREKAPPLTDSKQWTSFPFGDYEIVCIDALDSATEGVGEQDSAKVSRALASILDLARREAGPAMLLLGNAVKSGAHGRGSGVIEDRADIIYEVRDATNLQPSGQKPWIEELPPPDAASWAQRSTRRQRRDRYRLAFVPTEFRIGEEPEPSIIELVLSSEPWTLRDVTDEVDHVGADAREQRMQEARERQEAATAELAQTVRCRATIGHPILKGEAEELLRGHGFTRNAARELVAAGIGWRLEAHGTQRGRPLALLPVDGFPSPATTAAEIEGAAKPHSSVTCEAAISADQAGQARRKSPLHKSLSDKGFGEGDVSAAATITPSLGGDPPASAESEAGVWDFQ